MKNAQFSTEYVKRCCEKKREIEFRSGKEFNGWVTLENRKVARITVPKGKKSIPRKTYQSMASQLKLSVAEFDKLLECPLTKEQYKRIIKTRLR